MNDQDDQLEIIRKARQGDEECQNRLAEMAKVRLYDYVYRLTLEEDTADEVVQETVLEMFRVFHKLQKVERFWNWLCGIAYNKVRSHRNHRSRRGHVSLSSIADPCDHNGKDAVARMISDELKQIVIGSMDRLDQRQRDVIVMRCYQQMPYGDIGETMGISKFGARSLFCRAKKSLGRELSQYGLGKSFLIGALVLFGKLTATTEAAAAGVSVTAATLQTGILASAAAAVTTKTVMVSLAGAAVVAAGATALNYNADTSVGASKPIEALSHFSVPEAGVNSAPNERWHFYPEGPSGPVMMKLLVAGGGKAEPTCLYLQNQFASYYCQGSVVAMENHHLCNSDLSVMRLPTDSPEMSRFISSVEGISKSIEYCASTERGLLVICRDESKDNGRGWRIERHSRMLEETFFQYDWAKSVPVTDNRDAMHKRGWTYFTMEGHVNGHRITGQGRLPFFYAASKSHYPWISVMVDGRVRFVETRGQATRYDDAGTVVGIYEAGSFFKGLARPWMGLHTVDTVRRDAAEQRVHFETNYQPAQSKAEVRLNFGATTLAYIIDMETNVVEKIAYEITDGRDRKTAGELVFLYAGEAQEAGPEFSEPRVGGSGSARGIPDLMWLADLTDN